MNGSLAVPGRPDGKFVGLVAPHEVSIEAANSISVLGRLKPHVRWSVAARPQQIVRAAPQRDSDVAPARFEFGASAVSSRPATLAKPDGCALHRCGLQGGADHLESPPMLFPGACYDDVQDDSREVAEAHF